MSLPFPPLLPIERQISPVLVSVMDGLIMLIIGLTKSLLTGEFSCSKKLFGSCCAYFFFADGLSFYSHTYVDKFSGYYTLPDTPQDAGGLLYYFLGAENQNDSGSKGVTILQPVLTYYTGWYMNSWNCCPHGQSHESETLDGMGPGDKVFGQMYETGNLTTGKWEVVSSFNGKSVTLEVFFFFFWPQIMSLTLIFVWNRSMTLTALLTGSMQHWRPTMLALTVTSSLLGH